jgi:hypothetical protein
MFQTGDLVFHHERKLFAVVRFGYDLSIGPMYVVRVFSSSGGENIAVTHEDLYFAVWTFTGLLAIPPWKRRRS